MLSSLLVHRRRQTSCAQAQQRAPTRTPRMLCAGCRTGPQGSQACPGRHRSSRGPSNAPGPGTRLHHMTQPTTASEQAITTGGLRHHHHPVGHTPSSMTPLASVSTSLNCAWNLERKRWWPFNWKSSRTLRNALNRTRPLVAAPSAAPAGVSPRRLRAGVGVGVAWMRSFTITMSARESSWLYMYLMMSTHSSSYTWPDNRLDRMSLMASSVLRGNLPYSHSNTRTKVRRLTTLLAWRAAWR